MQDSFLPFEPSHDPAPSDLEGQRDAIRSLQAERDEALAAAGELCGFGPELLQVGDDLAALDRSWSVAGD